MKTGDIIELVTGAILTMVGLVIAYAQWKQAKTAQEAEDRQRRADDRRFALEVLEPLATPEVHEVLNSKPPQNTSLVEAIFGLCEVKVTELLPEEVRKDEKINATILKAMEPVQEFLARHGGPAYTESLERLEAVTDPQAPTRRGGADHTKYSWNGHGKHTKIWTINLIAQKWAKDRQLSTREAFEESFLAEIRKAVGDRQIEADRLLRDTTSADEKTNYVPELLLTLDGKQYGVTWAAGATSVSQVGVAVHKRIIEWFRTEHGYPAEPA